MEEEKEEEDEERKVLLSVCSLPLCVQGWKDTVDHLYLCPTNHRMSSTYALPRPPFPHRHTHTNPPPSWGLIRITQFMGISVWSVAEQIAGLRVIILITPCGCDYMCIWALRICVSVLRRIQRSGQYLMLPSRVCFGEAHLQVGRNIGAISKQ